MCLKGAHCLFTNLIIISDAFVNSEVTMHVNMESQLLVRDDPFFRKVMPVLAGKSSVKRRIDTSR